MMEPQKNGKLITINGPSFAGKTHLAHIMLSYILDNCDLSVSNVSWEMVYRKNASFGDMAIDFKKILLKKLLKFDIVISESTIYQLDYNDKLTIVCMPNVDTHVVNYNCYKQQFGEFDAIRRSYFDDIDKLRKQFNDIYKYPKNVITLDMTPKCIEECCKGILNYVSNK